MANLSQIQVGNTTYDLLDANALHSAPSPAEIGAIAAFEKGAAGGVASLDAEGKVPAAELPSYVDDVLEYADITAFPVTGESGKIYVALDTNKAYRWGGSVYVEISESLALGTTSGTAFRGDYGQTAYLHATEARLTTATATGLYKVSATSEGHIAGLTAVQKSDITALGIPATNTTYEDATTSAHGLMSTGDKSKLDGIESGANNYSLPTAAAGTLGGVKVGTGLSIDGSGVLSANGGGYTLPAATASTLGGVMVGTNLSIDGSGVLSSDKGTATAITVSGTTLVIPASVLC